MQAYEIIEQQYLSDIHSQGTIYRHKKTGAKVVAIQNDDKNKVFSISFRTPVENDKGIPHILEHAVFSGSEKYPLKEPFNTLMKGSLHTYLNAATYDDSTRYPVASTNIHDFCKLMDVYLGGVFHPLVLKKKEIFQQEGWHYNLKDQTLDYNGVVFNEMRGMEANVDFHFVQGIKSSLYPNTPYPYVSGGVPSAIVDLSYEELCAFHQKYYHPSNSVSVLYGDMDVAERLTYLDEQYFSQYEMKEAVYPIYEKPFSNLIHKEYEYPVDRYEDNQYYYAWSVKMCDVHDSKTLLALQLLDTILVSSPSAYLRLALNKAGIGSDCDSMIGDDLAQPCFAMAASQANQNEAEQFYEVIQNELKRIVKEGIDEEMLEASIRSLEFAYREEDFGTTPKGIVYTRRLLMPLLFHETNVLQHLQLTSVIEQLKEEAKHGYFEKMIEERILNNPHASLITLKPSMDYLKQQEQILKEKLNAYEQVFDINALKAELQRLDAFRTLEDSEEIKTCIPILNKDELNIQDGMMENEWRKIADCDVIYHDLETNGIAYLNLFFDLEGLSMEELRYAALMCEMIGLLSTKQHDYITLSQECGKYSGGIYTSIKAYDDTKTNRCIRQFEVKSRFLLTYAKEALSLIQEMMLETIYEDETRFLELLKELRSGYKSYLLNSAHQIALSEALALHSFNNYVQLQYTGRNLYAFLNQLIESFEQHKVTIMQNTMKIAKRIFVKNTLRITLGVSQKHYDELSDLLQPLITHLPIEARTSISYEGLKNSLSYKGFSLPSQVQYVALCGKLPHDHLKRRGHYLVLRHILDTDYLWQNIRIMGGAYGCYSIFSRNGYGSIVSYRDPNLQETIDVYQRIYDFVKNFDVNERELQEYIIGTMNHWDAPMSIASKINVLNQYALTGINEQDRNELRQQIVSTTKEDIRALADDIKYMLEHAVICVCGNQEALNAHPQFEVIEDVLLKELS